MNDEEFNKYFSRGCAEMLMYLTRHEDIEIEDEYICSDDFCLGKWLDTVRERWQEDGLTAKQERRLSLLGISKDKSGQSWEAMFKRAAKYYDNNGNCDMPVGYRSEDGMLVGAWADRQKRLLTVGNESIRDKEDRLREIGIVSDSTIKQEEVWQ